MWFRIKQWLYTNYPKIVVIIFGFLSFIFGIVKSILRDAAREITGQ